MAEKPSTGMWKLQSTCPDEQKHWSFWLFFGLYLNFFQFLAKSFGYCSQYCFPWVHWSVLRKSFLKKFFFAYLCSDVEWKLPELLAEHYRQGCQICLLRVQGIILRRCSIWRFSFLHNFFFETNHNIYGKLFCLSSQRSIPSVQKITGTTEFFLKTTLLFISFLLWASKLIGRNKCNGYVNTAG